MNDFYEKKLNECNIKRYLPKNNSLANYLPFLLSNNFVFISGQLPMTERGIESPGKIKKKVVEKDEKEKNLRKVLNFGHTFAHAYEATMGYSNKLNHGEAVLLGMNTALKFSKKNNYVNNNDYSSILNHMITSKLPNNLKKYFSIKHLDKIISFMLKDKKNSSEKINLILLKRIGSPIINKKFKKDKLKSFLKEELIN